MKNTAVIKLMLQGKLRFRESATLLGLRSSIHPRKYFVSDELKTVYIPISKSGNSSIKKMLLRAEGIPESELSHPTKPYFIHSNKNLKRFTQSRWRKKWDDYFTFTVVRNPVSRFISSHYNKFLDQEKIDQRGFELHRHLSGLFTPDLSAIDLLNTLMTISDKMTNEHFVPQKFWIYKHHKCQPSIYNLENLTPLIVDLHARGVHIKAIEHSNHSKGIHLTPVSKELLALIARRYKDDFVTFDYEAAVDPASQELDSGTSSPPPFKAP